jgi:hypothetical protein
MRQENDVHEYKNLTNFCAISFQNIHKMSALCDLSNKEMMKNYSRYLFLHGTGISQYKGTVSQD